MILLLISYFKKAVFLSVSLNSFILIWMLQKKYFMKN